MLATEDSSFFLYRNLSITTKKCLSLELTTSEFEKESVLLQQRRVMISGGAEPSSIRLRNLVLEKKINKVWTILPAPTADTESESESKCLNNASMSVLVYNARSLLDIKRRMAFANTSTSSDFHILCITETWLTSHVPNSALFLTDFTIYRTD